MQIDYPENLSEETRAFMDAVLKKLNEINAITDCDMGAIRMLMISYDMYVKASNDLLKTGPILYDKRNRPSVNPAANVTKNYYAQVVTFMKEFGLTLKSREHIKAMVNDVDDDNPLFQFLKNNNE